jgi:hypothetical protein
MSKWYFVPESWEMSEDLLKWTKEKGLTDKTIEDELESFRDHQYKRPMMRPDACWRNWVKNGIKWGSIVPVAVPTYRGVVELTPDEQKAEAAKWQKDMKERFGK